MLPRNAIGGLIACMLASLAPNGAQGAESNADALDGPKLEADAAPPVTSAAELEDGTNVGALAAGLGLLGLGSLSVAGGTVAYVTLSAHTAEGCEASGTACVDEHKAGKSGGILAIVLGGAAVTVSIPIIIGSTDESRTGKRKPSPAGGSAVLAPELRLAVGAASLTWSF